MHERRHRPRVLPPLPPAPARHIQNTMRAVNISALGLAVQPLLPEAVHKLDPKEWELYTLIGELRKTGYECVASDLSRSQVFAPNPDPYLFDCRLAEASKAHHRKRRQQSLRPCEAFRRGGVLRERGPDAWRSDGDTDRVPEVLLPLHGHD